MGLDVAVTTESVAQVNRIVDLTGVFANAILGGVVARGLRFDAVGFVVLAIVSGLGGGMVRDCLLQRGTAVALTDDLYIIMALVGALIAFFLELRGGWWNRALNVVDALALGCWAAAGSQKALAAGLSLLTAVLLGTITAVGGGVIRDLMVRRIPTIFGGNTLYATSAMIASLAMVAFFRAAHPTVGIVVSTLTGAGLTLVARRLGWVLPDAVTWRPTLGYPRPRLPRSGRRRR